MDLLRKILFPFAILYGWITGIRNFLYDIGLLKSVSYGVPVIAVGNLSVGGTGKTPQIEYLIRLLSAQYKVAVLSRGYKRKSKGFVLGDTNANAEILGDEPFQYHQKFPEIYVGVDADRRNGIEQLLKLNPKPDVILLDDAYQHRKVKAGFYILLTAYGDLYADDYMLPTGNLREGRSGTKRADVILVTKCPIGLSIKEQDGIRERLRTDHNQSVFFTYIDYDDRVFGQAKVLPVSDLIKRDKTLVAGIAKPQPFFKHLQHDKDTLLTFPDHHHFSSEDIDKIKKSAGDKLIITTEKDYVRLKDKLQSDQLFYLPIQTAFFSGSADFDSKIKTAMK
ncbi:MAG: tetraacyldisaccharide 4'-kinase [Flavobacterium sp. BFFFF1]|uniref:tetraacyldisaccharide 4'-kinase n=1 Tax=Flavobacterium sp. BFFFF1 TaxID=2015557 RepID=UPI000BC46E9D|nr:tetraacyldisaccharide 4'-kinase [Flavobacterium sp. BFFFF1]OYU80591.1 MAG: tetraacyldisaccharide 4'-kinase [Flavobacterium sp. BFFFF1]